jgi:hypothetical protein
VRIPASASAGDGRCDWGIQRRFVNGREQTRRCYASGFVTADGECIMA